MASFQYPKDLLHSSIEEQWFPSVSLRDTESTLTAIEAAEKAYAQRMARIVQPDTPPIVIGKQAHNSRSGSRRRRSGGRGSRMNTSNTSAANNNAADTSTDSATTMNDNTTVDGDEVSTIVQQRPPQHPAGGAASPAPTSLFWNRGSASAQRRSTSGQQPSA